MLTPAPGTSPACSTTDVTGFAARLARALARQDAAARMAGTSSGTAA